MERGRGKERSFRRIVREWVIESVEAKNEEEIRRKVGETPVELSIRSKEGNFVVQVLHTYRIEQSRDVSARPVFLGTD